MIDALGGVRRDTEDDMAEAAFDTLAYARRLKKAGVTDTLAEAHADALRAAFDEGTATRADLARLEERLVARLRGGLAALGTAVGASIVAAVAIVEFL